MNHYLVLLRQHYRELERLGEISELRWSSLRNSPLAGVAEHHSRSIDWIYRDLRAVLSNLVLDSNSILHGVGPELLDFYRTEFEPNAERIIDFHLDRVFSDFMIDADGDRDPPRRRRPLPDDSVPGRLLADWIALIWEEQIGWPMAQGDLPIDEQEYHEALRVLKAAYFHPDLWLENVSRLRPLLLSRDPSRIPSELRARLNEVYQSVVLGLPMAAIALARSVLEFAIIDRGRTFGVEVEELRRGERVNRRLRDLAEDLAEQRPELREELSVVVSWGNEALHAAKGKEAFVRDVNVRSARRVAFEAAARLGRILEVLYAGDPGR